MIIKKRVSDVSKFLDSLAGGKLTLGNLLLSIRQAEEITQVAFAKCLGISPRYLCDVEQGRRFVSPKAAAMFAKKLGFSQKQFVRLCLQDAVDRDGLHLQIDVRDAA